MRRILAGCLSFAAASAVGVVPADATASIGQRAYDASALAVPVNPEAGSHDSPIPARMFTTRADISNPPRAASARAARTDLGLLEQFVPGQALGPAADASTRDRNSGHNAKTTDGSAVYVAHADASPSASATASGAASSAGGVDYGSMSSTSSARQTGSRIIATATTTMSGIGLGPVSIGTATYTATATTNGQRGGARATGLVTADNASVGGVPVVVTQDGVQVDGTRIPAGQLDQAAAAVAAAFARSGYFDARVVQPTATQRPDGSGAAVEGGGIELVGRSDANQSYFLATTILSGSVSVDVGGSLGPLSLPVAPAPRSTEPPLKGSGLGPPYTPSAHAPADVASETAAHPAIAPLYTSRSDEVQLPQMWRWWPLLLGIAVALMMFTLSLRLRVMTPVRDRLGAIATAALDRYVRG